MLGKAKLAALKALRLTATGMTTIQGQSVPVEITRVFVLPDKMRIDAAIRGYATRPPMGEGVLPAGGQGCGVVARSAG